jgi:hypothetical protein
LTYTLHSVSKKQEFSGAQKYFLSSLPSLRCQGLTSSRILILRTWISVPAFPTSGSAMKLVFNSPGFHRWTIIGFTYQPQNPVVCA